MDMKQVLYVLLLAGALSVGASNYHFILFDDGIKILKKTEVTFEDTFVDARGAGKLQLLFKPALIRAGVKDILDTR
jgi:hypothetical protein